MSLPKRYLCDGCNRNTEAVGTYCDHCSKENDAVRKMAERLSLRPEFKGMGPSRIFLQLALYYLKTAR